VQHFNGLLKPSSGRVHVEGKDLSRSGIAWAELRQRVGMVFQYPEQQLFAETVFDEVSFVLRQRKNLSWREIEEGVKWACAVVGLDYDGFRRRSPLELSGGEMRRVALAGVLVQEPHILILDEPTVGLDGPGKQEILREIGQLRHFGKTLVIVSHAIEDFLDFVDRVIVLEEGRVFTAGAPSEVFSSLLQVGKFPFLVPSLFRLCHDLRREGWDIPEPTFRVEEALPILDRLLKKNPSAPLTPNGS